MADSPQDVYAKCLPIHHGYPLWNPEPGNTLPITYRQDGFQIGDVGIVDPDCGFEVFFNICQPPTHALHKRYGVPESHDPVNLNNEDVHVRSGAIPPGSVIFSSSVQRILSPGEALQNVYYEFGQASPDGALLILPHGATFHDLRPKSQFRDLAIRNAVRWYKFATQKLQRQTSNHSLYLITGFYKARSWSFASFQNVSPAGGLIRAIKIGIANNFLPTKAASAESFHLPRIRQHVIPLSDIRANIDVAVKACSPKERPVLHRLNNMEAIKESLTDRYCDISGQVGHLKPVGELPVRVFPDVDKTEVVKVFTTEDVPDHGTFVASRRESLDRFLDIITPIAGVYNLSMTSLNIFYDIGVGPIAFNRDGSIFLNLRYFETWHDQDVKNGAQQQAQTSWFFTLAHEIAHNLVISHNSDHAFWFSAICESYTPVLMRVLINASCETRS